MTDAMTREPNASFFCTLLHDALENEEREILDIGARGPAEEHLLSVAFAPELAIGYLVRKQALRQGGVAIEGERQYEGHARKSVDVCTVDGDGNCTASLEIKGPIGDWNANRNDKFLKDIEKHFDPRARIKNATSSAKRYNGWILIERVATKRDELIGAVHDLLSRSGRLLDEKDVSEAIKINRTSNVVHKDRAGNLYENLRVIVFSAQLRPER